MLFRRGKLLKDVTELLSTDRSTEGMIGVGVSECERSWTARGMWTGKLCDEKGTEPEVIDFDLNDWNDIEECPVFYYLGSRSCNWLLVKMNFFKIRESVW